RRSTSTHRRIPGLREQKGWTGAALKGRPSTRRGRRTQENQKECRTAKWLEKGIRSSTIPAIWRHSATVELQATRREALFQERMHAARHATFPISSRA